MGLRNLQAIFEVTKAMILVNLEEERTFTSAHQNGSGSATIGIRTPKWELPQRENEFHAYGVKYVLPLWEFSCACNWEPLQQPARTEAVVQSYACAHLNENSHNRRTNFTPHQTDSQFQEKMAADAQYNSYFDDRIGTVRDYDLATIRGPVLIKTTAN